MRPKCPNQRQNSYFLKTSRTNSLRLLCLEYHHFSIILAQKQKVRVLFFSHFVFFFFSFALMDPTFDLSIFRSFDLSIFRFFDLSIFRSFHHADGPDFSFARFRFDGSIFRSFDLSFFRSFQSALLQEIQNQSTVRFFLSKKGGESPFLCAFRFPISGGLANAVEPSRRPNGGNKHDSTGSFLDFASVSFTLSSLLYFLSLFAHFNGSHLTSG